MSADGLLSPWQLAMIWALPILLAVTLHEIAHGWAADRLGDSTARDLGRLTLNPFKHIDPIGTVVVPAVVLMVSGFIFGWAKPVPITWAQLGSPRRDVALVAAAGPIANALMAILWSGAVYASLLYAEGLGVAAQPLLFMGIAGIAVNIFLMVLNLLPLPPLDGGRVLHALLPSQAARIFGRIEPFGLPILIGLLVVGWLPAVLFPVAQWLQSLLIPLQGADYYWVFRVLTGGA
ncbi:MAG: site-2 protease family protein [Pseudomonadota bacterium]